MYVCKGRPMGEAHTCIRRRRRPIHAHIVHSTRTYIQGGGGGERGAGGHIHICIHACTARVGERRRHSYMWLMNVFDWACIHVITSDSAFTALKKCKQSICAPKSVPMHVYTSVGWSGMTSFMHLSHVRTSMLTYKGKLMMPSFSSAITLILCWRLHHSMNH